MDIVVLIVFYNLWYYFIEFFNYYDVCFGVIQLVEDLFGLCLALVVQVINVWYVVGVGMFFVDLDLQLLFIFNFDFLFCGLLEEIFLIVELAYISCFIDVGVGMVILLAFQVNDGVVLEDILVLEEVLVYQDILSFMFSMLVVVFVELVMYEIKVWAVYGLDNIVVNDMFIVVIENILVQNFDFSVELVCYLVFVCFMGVEIVEVEVWFNGCDFIVVGMFIILYYQLNDGAIVVEEGMVLVMIIWGESFFYNFQILVDIFIQNVNIIDVWVVYFFDFFNQNDMLVLVLAFNLVLVVDYGVFIFEVGVVFQDFFFVDVGFLVQVSFLESVVFIGGFGLFIMGINSFEVYQQGVYILLIGSNVWKVNFDYGVWVCFCVDLINVEDLLL